MENIADHGTNGPRKYFMLAERKKERKKKGERKKRGEKEKKGKKEKKEKERKKKKGQKKNRKKKESNCTNNHFVQGQILGVGGAPQIISERTLIA